MDAQSRLPQTDVEYRWHGSGDAGKPGEITMSMVATRCDKLERGPYAHGTDLVSKYAPGNMPQGQLLRRDHLIADVGSFGEYFEPNSEMRQGDTAPKIGLASDKFVQFASRDEKGATVPMVPAKYAWGCMIMMQSRVGFIEETNLRLRKDTRLSLHDVGRATEVRDWMEAHDGRKPVQNAVYRDDPVASSSAEVIDSIGESSLGEWMKTLKKRGSSAEIAGVCVILRDHPSAVTYFKQVQAEETVAKAKQLNALLRLGFGPEPEVKQGLARQQWSKQITGIDNVDALQNMYYNFIRGSLYDYADIILEVGEELTEEKAEQRRATHEAGCEKVRERNRKRTETCITRAEAKRMLRDVADAKVLNRFLKDGYGQRNEAIESKGAIKKLTVCSLGDDTKALLQLRLMGSWWNGGKTHITDHLLVNLPEGRAATLRKRHESAKAAKAAAEAAAASTPAGDAASSSGATTAVMDVDQDAEEEEPVQTGLSKNALGKRPMQSSEAVSLPMVSVMQPSEPSDNEQVEEEEEEEEAEAEEAEEEEEEEEEEGDDDDGELLSDSGGSFC